MVFVYAPRSDKSSLRTSWLAIAKGRGYGPGWVEMRFDGSSFSEPGNFSSEPFRSSVDL